MLKQGGVIMNSKSKIRRYDLDWLRVLAIFSVFIYHTTRFFNSEYWIVKNPTSNFIMDILETVMANWTIALIFVISGASLYFALGKGTVREFIKDKILRLVVPMVSMGMVCFGVIQIYLDRLTHAEYDGTFLDFIPQYFQPSNFAWTGVHLWYLGMLFLFCIVFLPILLLLKNNPGRTIMERLGDLLSSRWKIYLLALPTVLCLVLTDGASFLGNTDWGGGSILSHATFFLSGFLIISHKGLQTNIQRHRKQSLYLLVILFFIIFSFFMIFGESSTGKLINTVGRALWGFWSWSWVLAILGYGMEHLQFNKRFLSYANEAVLPFYILHHPVLLLVGYFVVQWSLPIVLKFILIDIFSFTIIMILYEFIVRRFAPLRFLFGMKLLTRSIQSNTQEVQVINM
jgi:glucan biosynthesis protein C